MTEEDNQFNIEAGTKIVTKKVRVFRQPECGWIHYIVVVRFVCGGRINENLRNTDQLRETKQYQYEDGTVTPRKYKKTLSITWKND